MKPAHLALLASALALPLVAAHADSFGSGSNAFTIDFVTVGNAGNANDRAYDNTDDTPGDPNDDEYATPSGGVAYTYRMGAYEISQDAITKATDLGMTNVVAGAWSTSQPAANMEWYEAAAFVNWLNTSTGHQEAYDLAWDPNYGGPGFGGWTMSLWSSGDAWQAGGENLYRHKDAYYFLPSEDEWYKAAYHKNDGVTANYWDYATGSNSIPDGIDFDGDTSFDAVYYDGYDQDLPNSVSNVGLASPYGTYGQNGNVWEWNESAFDGPNNDSHASRVLRGGSWFDSEDLLRSPVRYDISPGGSDGELGFRVASVPEPSTALLMLSGLGALLLKRRGKSAL